jgi:hypothetical protein
MTMSMARVALSVFLLLQICFFLFGQRPVFLVLLMLVDEVAGGYNLQASKDDHGGECIEIDSSSVRQ